MVPLLDQLCLPMARLSTVFHSPSRTQPAPPCFNVENLLAILINSGGPGRPTPGANVDEIVSIAGELQVWDFKDASLRWDV